MRSQDFCGPGRLAISGPTDHRQALSKAFSASPSSPQQPPARIHFLVKDSGLSTTCSLLKSLQNDGEGTHRIRTMTEGTAATNLQKLDKCSGPGRAERTKGQSPEGRGLSLRYL